MSLVPFAILAIAVGIVLLFFAAQPRVKHERPTVQQIRAELDYGMRQLEEPCWNKGLER